MSFSDESRTRTYDPENAGYFIRDNVPRDAKRDDFQHYPMWREFNYSMFKYMDQESDQLIIAMTVTNAEYFDQIVGNLRRDGVKCKDFTLCASKEVLLDESRTRTCTIRKMQVTSFAIMCQEMPNAMTFSIIRCGGLITPCLRYGPESDQLIIAR